MKLVSESGVGTIVTGAEKAYADLTTITGDGGGTDTSSLSSVKYAGCPRGRTGLGRNQAGAGGQRPIA